MAHDLCCVTHLPLVSFPTTRTVTYHVGGYYPTPPRAQEPLALGGLSSRYFAKHSWFQTHHPVYLAATLSTTNAVFDGRASHLDGNGTSPVLLPHLLPHRACHAAPHQAATHTFYGGAGTAGW